MTDRTPDPIIRLNAALEGRYRIERELGAGGMATVYLAQDLKHDRQVAIKVLRPELAAVVGGERFLTEIKTTANLQHPHILPLFDSGEADSFLFYVMPYVPGDSLRERLDREKQLPVAEALAIMRKVADAVDYAHENGVVHRDIKPANILLSERGEPLVADFGIALAVAQAGGGRITETGLSLGTPHYMSPEQATGDRDVNPRSDVYALGCVLFEMLAGEPPFAAPTAQAVLAKILTSDAPLITTVRRTVPPHVESALAQALEKLPADRFGSAAEFSAALEDEDFTYTARTASRVAAAPAPTPTMAPPAAPSRPAAIAFIPWVLAGVGILLGAWGLTRSGPPAQVATLYLSPGELEPREFAISPDGSTLAAVARVEGEQRVLVRRLDQPRFQVLTETEGAYYPTFSPDGRWIAYVDRGDEAIRRVSVTGGSPNTLMQIDGLNPGELNWGPDGDLTFYAFEDAGGTEGVFRLAESGGGPELLLPDADWAYHPRLLPGGRGILLQHGQEQETRVLDLRGDSVFTLLNEAVGARYVETGHLVFAHPDGGLQAVRFDPASLRIQGDVIPVRDALKGARFNAPFDVSRNGTLVYIDGLEPSGPGESRLARLDLRTGEVTPDEVLRPRSIINPRFSPDGVHLTFSTGAEGGGGNLFAYEHELGIAPRQLTFTKPPSQVVGTATSPDGESIVFGLIEGGPPDLWTVPLDGTSPPAPLLEAPGAQIPTDWVAPGILLYENRGTSSGASRDLWILDPSAPDSARPFLVSEVGVGDAHVSPDGELVAYESQEFDRDGNVVVRRFPDPGQPLRVSDSDAGGPRWSPDGTRLYYWTTGDSDTLKVATIRREPSLAVLSKEVIAVLDIREWDLHPLGEWGMLTIPVENSETSEEGSGKEEIRYVVVLNWFEELRDRMGEER